jgi:hypothetical protein
MLAAAKFRCWGSLLGLILRILGKDFEEVQVRGLTTGGTGVSRRTLGKTGIGLISCWLGRTNASVPTRAVPLLLLRWWRLLVAASLCTAMVSTPLFAVRLHLVPLFLLARV